MIANARRPPTVTNVPFPVSGSDLAATLVEGLPTPEVLHRCHPFRSENLLPLASKSLEEKRRAHAAVDKKSGQLARFLEGLYELEGHDVLSAKVRPSSHQQKAAPDVEVASNPQVPRREAVPESGVEETPETPEPGVAAVGGRSSPVPRQEGGGIHLVTHGQQALAAAEAEGPDVFDRTENDP